jgi:hypothetical protein
MEYLYNVQNNSHNWPKLYENILLFFLIESQSGQIVQKKLFALAQQSRSQISLSFERHPDIHVNVLYLQFGFDKGCPFNGRTKVCIYVYVNYVKNIEH